MTAVITHQARRCSVRPIEAEHCSEGRIQLCVPPPESIVAAQCAGHAHPGNLEVGRFRTL